MKILVINTGSSSLKFRLFRYNDLKLLAKGLVERIGGKSQIFKISWNDKVKEMEVKAEDHKAAFKLVIDELMSDEYGLIKNISEIKGVGHRVVHGAEKFAHTVLIDNEVIEILKECIPLAPLHNPANLAGIYAAKAIIGDVPNVGVFDTAFHQTLDEKAFLYALPYEYYEKMRIRRYGFHGTSHKFVSLRVYELLNQKPEGIRMITCHLGNGASLAAIKDGISVDTSMGMTPLEGVVMGTRSGDFDPAIILFIMRQTGLSVDEVDKVLNKKSGLLGLSGISNDIRDVEAAADKGNERAKLAIDVYCYRIKKYIGAYAAAMEGLTDLVFTAGLGENDPLVREKSCKGLEFLGIKLDPDKNDKPGSERLISADDSRVRVWIIPTDEELMIARETKEVIGNLKKVPS
ncbi:MAG: acetate kinase [Candidatus Eremiobacteraeota bacterium]|nr:acetate kinase [Candidatus Eremiobacteraeota bacterium]